MITQADEIFLDMIKKQMIGQALPPRTEGLAGRAIEDMLIDLGIPLNKNGTIDIPGLDLEVKSRDARATSPQTTGAMTYDAIINTPNYFDTTFYKKICKQLRFTTNGPDDNENINIIESIDIVDFNQPQIQDQFAAGYVHSRQQLIDYGKIKTCKHKGFYTYLEQVNNSDSYALRLDLGKMNSAIAMSNSTFQSLFEYNV